MGWKGWLVGERFESYPSSGRERSFIVDSCKEGVMKKSAARLLLITTAVLLLFITAHSAAWSAEPPTGKTAALLQPAGLTDPAELETFIDGMMAAHFPSRHISAAAVAVGKGGA